MFRNFYQDGTYLEIFNTQDKTLLSKWKLPAKGRKEFDNEARTYVYCLRGATTTSKIESKKESRKGAGLVQPYVVFQVKVPHTADISIEVGVICFSQYRRIFFSTSQKSIRVTPALRAIVPLSSELRGRWTSLCIDVPDLVSGFWKGETFQYLDSITVGGTFCLRKIFTMKYFVTTSLPFAMWKKTFITEMPKPLQLPYFLPQEWKLINTATIGYDSSHGKSTKLENKSEDEMNLSKYNILAGRYSTESLPCPVAGDLEMQSNRTRVRSQSYSEGNPGAKSGYLIINSSKQKQHYRRPSVDENQVSALHPKRSLNTVRHSRYRRENLHKGDFNHETRTLISELGGSHSSSPTNVSPNQCKTLCKYQFSDLLVTGKEIKNPFDTEKVSANRIKCEVKEKFRPLNHLDLRSSSITNCFEEPTAATQSDGRKNQQNHTNSTTYLTNYNVLHSEITGSSAYDENELRCEMLKHRDSYSPDQNVKLECEEFSQYNFENIPFVVDINSVEAKVHVSENAAEDLNEMFEKLSMDDLQNCGSVTDIMADICDDTLYVDSTSFDPNSSKK